MQSALSQRVIAARGDVMMKTHSVVEADYGRDALSKAIYDRLFTWIIGRINKSIVVPGHKSTKRFNNVLGVLDIYGFEIFERNSFEQFCINYCNEKLQQLFIGRFERNMAKKELNAIAILCRVGAEAGAGRVQPGGDRMDQY